MKFRSLILFTILTLSGFVFAQDTPTQENTGTRGYTLGPGDQVAGTVHGEMGYDFVGTVDEDGMLAVPFMKRLVSAQCRTERELKAEIEIEIKKYLRDPSFNLRVTEKHSRPPVSISGEINKPSEIILTRKATLLEILSVAGGPKEEASGEIQVTRPKTPLCMTENDPDNWKTVSIDATDVASRTYSYSKVMLGKEDSNPTIYPGDRILVKRAAPVYINGEVVGGQAVLLKENGLSLAGAIGMVGGGRPEANIKNIAIYRLKPGASRESQDRDLISANLKLIRQGKEKDVMLQPYDLIVVDKAKKSIGVVIAEMALNAAKSGASSFTNVIPYRIVY